MNNWYEFKAFAGKNHIYIDDDIGQNGITAKYFRQELEKFKGPVDVHINSAGGSVTEGLGIYNMLVKHTGKKTVYIDSLAASMASMIAMAGDEIHMASNALMMIHNPWGVSAGDSREHRKTADLLDKMTDALVLAYENKTSLPGLEIRDMMNEETWLTGYEALEKGFTTHVIDAVKPQNVTRKMKSLIKLQDLELLHTASSIGATRRESAALICNKRKIATPANLFKSQSNTDHYTGIKNV
jgi:ATP-dependent protease ClpP protease subunit